MWIYKHAYFRRDEPELLHALKRKTNQHGARIGDPNADDEMMAARVVIPRRSGRVMFLSQRGRKAISVLLPHGHPFMCIRRCMRVRLVNHLVGARKFSEIYYFEHH